MAHGEALPLCEALSAQSAEQSYIFHAYSSSALDSQKRKGAQAHVNLNLLFPTQEGNVVFS
jgi:hypothetical protein